MTDSWKTNKETKRDNSGDRVSRFFVLEGNYKIIRLLSLCLNFEVVEYTFPAMADPLNIIAREM